MIPLLIALGVLCVCAAWVSALAAIDDYLPAWKSGLAALLFFVFLISAVGCWAYAGALHRA